MYYFGAYMMDPLVGGLHGKRLVLGFIPSFVVWNLLIILILAGILYWLFRSSRGSGETALEIVGRRYAAGEIGRDEFLRIRKDLVD